MVKITWSDDKNNDLYQRQQSGFLIFQQCILNVKTLKKFDVVYVSLTSFRGTRRLFVKMKSNELYSGKKSCVKRYLQNKIFKTVCKKCGLVNKKDILFYSKLKSFCTLPSLNL
jgi:hypothetical protein